MSPEQATGDQSIGPASDTYAVACVLYEMLTGEPPYTGSTAQAVLGRIIQGEPMSATAVRRSVPAHVDAAIRKALEKLPADRFSGAQDFARALGEPSFRHGVSGDAQGGLATTRWRTAALALAVTTVLALVVGMTGVLGGGDEAPEALWVEINPPGSENLGVSWGRYMALAPDGSGMVYRSEEGAVEGGWVLYYKPRGTTEGTLMPGTEGAHDLVMSPDGQWVAFIQNGRVVKRPVRGGATVTLAEDAGDNVTALDWLDDGTILYELAEGDVLVRIPEDGGAVPDTVADPQSLRWARALPGGDAALLLDCPGCRMGIADFASREIDYVLDNVARAWYVPTGHIVYVRDDGAVFASEFDLKTRTLAAGGTPLFDGVRTGSGIADMVVGRDGTMIFVRGAMNGQGDVENLVWVDEDGRASLVDPEWPAQNLDAPALSPDETRIALPVWDANGLSDIWVKELPGGPLTRLTRGGGRVFQPRWSADGRWVLYTFYGTGLSEGEVRRIRADGSQPEAESLLVPEANIRAVDLVPGGEGLVIGSGENNEDLAYWDPAADSVTWLLRSDYAEMAPAVSPDGRWLAYTSDVAGAREVFVRPFPDVSASRTQVSVGGGREPVWSPDLNELYYRTADSLVAASFTADTTFRVDSRTQLFEMGRLYMSRPGARSYDVGRGRRFLMAQNAEMAVSDADEDQAMILVQNWFTELRERLGGG
jgi:serine/threonine-protein kinase